MEERQNRHATATDAAVNAGAADSTPFTSATQFANEGQRLLVEVKATQQAIADSLGCTRPNVSYWLRGKSLPGASTRRLVQKVYGIPAGAWDRKAGSAAKCTPNSSSPAAAEIAKLGATLAELDERVAWLRRMRDDEDATPGERVRIADLEVKALAHRARIERDAEQLELRIVNEHPAWFALRNVTINVLKAHPAVMREWLDAIRRYDPSCDRGAAQRGAEPSNDEPNDEGSDP